MKVSIAFLVAALSLSSLRAQDSGFRENLDVNVVLLDATVTDSKGRQILGLTSDDFIVREDGIQQKIDSVDYFTNRRLLNSSEGNAALKLERSREERYFIIFFQNADLGRVSQARLEARNAALSFVEKELLPGDRVAVAAHDVRLKLFSDFTSDKKVLKDAITQSAGFALGITRPDPQAPEPSILRNLDVPSMMGGTGRIYDALHVLADALTPIQARKVLILFTRGIGEVSDFSPYLTTNEDYLYVPMVRALNGANVSVFGINLLRTGQFNATEGTVQRLASETGGEYFRNVVNFLSTMRRIENINNGYYLLTYTAHHPKGTSGYQKIDLTPRNREFRIKVRQGYPYGN